MADNTVGLGLGYGRERTGRIGRLVSGNPAGFNAYKLRTAAAEHFASGGKLSLTGETYELASTQEHGTMEGRPVIREANKEQFEKFPAFAKNVDIDAPHHMAHIAREGGGSTRPQMIYQRPPMNGIHQWGMSIDLNSCVGCTACVAACYSENNIPIVGKNQVAKGREMAWIRIDRYYAGTVDDPEMALQPMLCQHCENAPCESVCPVNATSHDDEGLNVMTYNRCVGTRYCSNNCPYKVRRFNFLDYNKRSLDKLTGPVYPNPFTMKTEGEWDILHWAKNVDRPLRPQEEWDLLKLLKNPDVTVRMRGIMEKCTYCVQRIEQAKIAQKVHARDSGDIRLKESEHTTPKTACQQACPAEAIVFGDVSDPESRVSKLKKQERDYTVLGFLDTRARTTYLARIRNPNKLMPDYHESPLTLAEYEHIRHDNPFKSAHGEGHGAAHDGGHEAPAAHEKKGAH